MTAYIKKIAMPVLGAAMAASLALSPIGATPARADDRGAAIAATGIIALITAGIIASEANNSRFTFTTNRGHEPHHPPFGSRYEPRRAPPPPAPPVRAPRAQRAKELPRECREVLRFGNDRQRVYKKGCLKREMPRWAFLPERCETRVRVPGQRAKTVLTESCLRDYGFKPERR